LASLRVEESRQQALCIGNHLNGMDTPAFCLPPRLVLTDANEEKCRQKHQKAKEAGQPGS
jgi:hypothetical protein